MGVSFKPMQLKNKLGQRHYITVNLYHAMNYLFKPKYVDKWMHSSRYDETQMAQAAEYLCNKNVDEFELLILDAKYKWTEKFKKEKERIEEQDGQ